MPPRSFWVFVLGVGLGTALGVFISDAVKNRLAM